MVEWVLTRIKGSHLLTMIITSLLLWRAKVASILRGNLLDLANIMKLRLIIT